MPNTMPESQALTDRDRKEFDKALAEMARIIPEVDRAEAVGRDVTPYRQRIEDLRQKIVTYKRVYWPLGQ